jgi:AcrR family transcriptional regulator
MSRSRTGSSSRTRDFSRDSESVGGRLWIRTRDPILILYRVHLPTSKNRQWQNATLADNHQPIIASQRTHFNGQQYHEPTKGQQQDLTYSSSTTIMGHAAKRKKVLDMKREHNLYERVVTASKELFFAKGYFPTNTREIATKAGTSESGIFRLFPNKFAILAAVYNSCWEEVNKHLERSISGLADPRDKVMAIVRSFWELYEHNPSIMTFVISNFGSADTLLISRQDRAIVTDEANQHAKRVATLCAAVVQQGIVDQRITAAALREYVFSIAQGILVGWYLADRTPGGRSAKVGIEEALLPLSLLLYPERPMPSSPVANTEK